MPIPIPYGTDGKPPVMPRSFAEMMDTWRKLNAVQPDPIKPGDPRSASLGRAFAAAGRSLDAYARWAY